MKLLIISDAPILSKSEDKEAYAPYVKEMDLWMQHSSDVSFVCPTKYDRKLLTQPFKKQDFKVTSLRRLEFHTLLSAFISLITIPYQAIVLWNAMRKADHIHLRCPGNLALLACLMQITLPRKRKTVKYAGNFDPHASQPLSYRWQKKILSNTALTKNIDVLVYGEWPEQTKNIKPFFTATYSESDKGSFLKEFNEPYQFIFVGTLSQNKNPQLLVELMEQLHKEGVEVQAHFYGDGPMMEDLKTMAAFNSTPCYFYGNQNSEVLKSAYKKAHFSFLASQSEGWPKAVAESMWYGCIPIATSVSCVPWMLGVNEEYKKQKNTLEHIGSRGLIFKNKEQAIFDIKKLISTTAALKKMSQNAVAWSQDYTIEKFEREIVKLVHS
ncbi:glycosyltransferase family 4 protein [uncultured Nonlabens sp.]|uniref:glycosyltransferase family 4 protein n=1 Tax=uncultured Nonlabens sp. TaxID=859306 RepID=UPI0026154433|nr:glycosyltransferase family 4 protein [uncultured Nonlabens sp.]